MRELAPGAITPYARQQGVLTDTEIYARRVRVTVALLVQAVEQDRIHEGMPVKHLWWPDPLKPGKYELRSGNPPADQDRPLHLRQKDLHIDPLPTGEFPSQLLDDIRKAIRRRKKTPRRKVGSILTDMPDGKIKLPHK